MVPGWFFTVPQCFLCFSKFQVSFFVPEFFLWFFKVLGWFFMVSDGFFWVLKVPGWFFTVPGGVLWFFKVPGWFFIVPSGSSWFFMVSLQNVPARTVSWPDNPI